MMPGTVLQGDGEEQGIGGTAAARNPFIASGSNGSNEA